MIGERAIPYVACALLRYANIFGEDGIVRGDLEAVTGLANDASGFKIPNDISIEALNLLVKARLAFVSDDRFAGAFYRINGRSLAGLVGRADAQEAVINKRVKSQFDDYAEIILEPEFSDLLLVEEHEPLRLYHEFGDDWLEKALSNLSNVSLDDVPDFLSDSAIRAMPDRMVILKRSDAQVAVAKSTIDEISEALSTDNALGETLGDDRSAAKAELEAAKVLLSADRVRAKTLLRLLSSTLRWLSEKAAGSVVSEACKSLWKLIQEIIF